MCISAAALGAIASGVGAVKSLTSKPKTSSLDPVAERAAADARATQAANAKLADRNRSRKASALSVDTATSDVAALGGKSLLGQ